MVDSTDTPLDALTGRLGRRVRAHRATQSMSLGDLARASGLSKTILAKIESGEGNPSVETLWRLARALHLPLGALVAEDDEPRVRIIRKRSGEAFSSESGMDAWLVHAEGREHRSELFELSLPKGVDHAGTPHLPGTEELVVCLSGRISVGPAGHEAELGAGDSLWFAADGPHVYRGLRDSRALDFVVYPSTAR